MFKSYLAVLAVLIGAGHLSASNTITNYKSGISIGLSGTDGTDYVFERWYGDSLIDDHGVIYIKSSLPISFSHNERNINNRNVDSIGVIRYKVDRDLGYSPLWSNRRNFGAPFYELPAYTAPLVFDDLTYAPERPGDPVVGTTGPVPGTVYEASTTSYHEHWYRGLTDAAGDEWHIITVGDDDTELMDLGLVGDQSTNMRLCGSDGKIHYFIVNPTTPCIWFTAADSAAQWYSTPPKAYFIPKLHEQTTYLTDGVLINLANIMSAAPVMYRLDDGTWTAYAGPISADGLADGPHTLECYYTAGTVRTRTLVKNPGFSSDNDRFADGTGHGYLLWPDDEYLDGIKVKMFSGDTNRVRNKLRSRYATLKRNNSIYGNGRDWFEDARNKGDRVTFQGGKMFITNTFIPVFEGLAANETHARAVKGMLLENEFSIDPVGYELDMNFSVVPSHRERTGLGYYNGKTLNGMAGAYDLLIKNYRYPEYEHGFTPIEDLKVRDLMAGAILNYLHDRQGFLYHAGMGITPVSRNIYALVASMAMPSYSTPYYGTSGFDGSTATGTWLPFPDQAATWKELFYLNNVPRLAYPNQAFGMNVLVDTLLYDFVTMGGDVKAAGSTDGNIKPDGISNYPSSSIQYNDFHQVGSAIAVYANTMRIRPGHGLDLSYLNRYFAACIDSQQPPDLVHSNKTGFYPNPWVLNERFPEVAERAISRIFYESIDVWTLSGADAYAPVYINDDWENWVSAIDETRASIPAVLSGIVNPVADRFVIPAANGIDPATVRLYRVDGSQVSAMITNDAGAVRADVSSLPAGIYHYTVGSGDSGTAGTFIKQ